MNEVPTSVGRFLGFRFQLDEKLVLFSQNIESLVPGTVGLENGGL